MCIKLIAISTKLANYKLKRYANKSGKKLTIHAGFSGRIVFTNLYNRARLLPSVRTLLKNGNVEVRIEAGEFIAHVFELGRDYDELFDEQVS